VVFNVLKIVVNYSETLLIRINWDGEPSGHGENLDFSLKISCTGSVKWKKIFYKWLFYATHIYLLKNKTHNYIKPVQL